MCTAFGKTCRTAASAAYRRHLKRRRNRRLRSQVKHWLQHQQWDSRPAPLLPLDPYDVV